MRQIFTLKKTFRLLAKADEDIINIENLIEEIDEPPLTDTNPQENATFGNIPEYLLKSSLTQL